MSCSTSAVHIHCLTCLIPQSFIANILVLVGRNVVMQEWNELSTTNLKQLKDGKIPQRPPLKTTFLANLSTPEVRPQGATFQNYGYLLRTNFFAVKGGEHAFTSNCNRWCRLWIKSVDGCYTKELVLEQERRDSDE